MDEPLTLTSEILVEPIQRVGGDHMVVAAARVVPSAGDAARLGEPERRDECAGVINYLMKQRHGTPFEHASLTLYCHAPLFVWREWHRHRVGFSYNEESARYRPLKPVFWIPRRDRLMMVPPGHKPARPVLTACEDDEMYNEMVRSSHQVNSLCFAAYQHEVRNGVALEVARRHLPVSIYTSGWVTCNPRSLMHFLSVRTFEQDARFTSYPQAEIEEAARAMEQMFEAGWPLTWEAFERHGRLAP